MTFTEHTTQRLAWTVFLGVVVVYLSAAAVGVATNTLGNAGDVTFSLLMFLFPLVGILICRQQPRNRIGWICLGIGVVWGFSAILDGIGQWGIAAAPGTVPGWQVAEALSGGLWAPALGVMGTFLILLFPDGHLPNRRWRWVAWLSAVTIIVIYALVTLSPGRLEIPGRKVLNPLGLDLLNGWTNRLLPLVALLPLCFVLCATALVLRFRRARGVERAQLKWLAAAAVLLAVTYFAALLVSLPTGIWGESDPPWVAALQALASATFALVPIAIGFATLKYHLYEVDVVINKAVVFGALAVFIAVVYVGIVVGLGALLPRVVKRDDLGLSIVATAVVALAFQPVRLRVQRYANRLVYGARATPYEVLSDFASRMQRAYTGPDLLSHMARTLAEGVGAAQAAVWLNVGDSLTREAAWPRDDDDPDDVPASDGVLPDLPGDLVVPVRQDDELLGAITVFQAATDPVTPGETKLVHDVAAQAGLLLRNARLIEELRSSRQRLVTAQDEERRRLERDLHDGAQQSLVSVALTLRLATGQLAKTAPNAVPPIEQASEQLATAIDELRELARGIHPAILTEGGLGAAVNSLAERSPVPVTVENQLAGRPPSAIEATAYFVVAEALTNAVKHAQASLVTVSLEVSGDVLTVTVADDGRGGVDLNGGTGLRGLTDRVSAADGDLHVESPPGGGTRLVCTLPLPRQRVPEQPGPERGDLVASAAVGADR